MSATVIMAGAVTILASPYAHYHFKNVGRNPLYAMWLTIAGSVVLVIGNAMRGWWVWAAFWVIMTGFQAGIFWKGTRKAA